MANDKDKTQKIITSIPEVFADIYNVLLFKNGRHITPEGLRELDPKREVTFLGDIFDQEEDVVKMWEPERRPLMILTLENLTQGLSELPMKILSYLGAGYRWELHQIRAAKEGHASQLEHYVPIYALVLYLNAEKSFSGHLTLSEQLGLDENGKKGFIDIKVEMIDVGSLPREIIDTFTSSFFWVADFIWQKRNLGTYNKPENGMELANILELINALTAMGAGIPELGQFRDKDGRKIMLNELNRKFEEGREEGRVEGREEGRVEGREEGRVEGREEGRVEGRGEGESKLLKLFNAVARAGKNVLEAMKKAENPQEREKLYAEYGIS